MDPPSSYCTDSHKKYEQYDKYEKPCCWRGCVLALTDVKHEMAAQMIAADTEPALTITRWNQISNWLRDVDT